MRNPRPRLHPRFIRNSSCSTTNPAFEAQLHGNQPPRNLNFTQQQINAALFNNSIPQYSVQPIVRQSTKSPHSFENMGFSVVPQQQQQQHQQQFHHHPPSAIVAPSGSRAQSDDLHMAERLVQQCAQKSAFKFDTINNQSSSGRSKATVVAIGSGNPVAGSSIKEGAPTTVETTAEIAPLPVSEKRRSRGEECSSGVKTLESSSDDNGGFVTPPDEQQQQTNNQQSKIPKPPLPPKHNKPTVVGNPMFANTPDSELGPGESLGLDDLDMDYEQIMHYFDNLKVSV